MIFNSSYTKRLQYYNRWLLNKYRDFLQVSAYAKLLNRKSDALIVEAAVEENPELFKLRMELSELVSRYINDFIKLSAASL